jgi:hypothetical protein
MGSFGRHLRGGGGHRRDANEPEIIERFEQFQCIVKQISAKDVPDLLIYPRRARAKHWRPVEVKMPGERLRAGQQDLYDVAPFDVVESLKDVDELCMYWMR